MVIHNPLKDTTEILTNPNGDELLSLVNNVYQDLHNTSNVSPNVLM